MTKHKEPSRIRINGTRVTDSSSGPQRIMACRDIVEKRQYAKIDGVMIDLFTASAIVQAHDELAKRGERYAHILEKFLDAPIHLMGLFALKLVR